MDKLRAYLKTLTLEQKHAYAAACGTTLGYLRRSMSVNQRLDGRTCRLLDEHSGGFVKKQELRPDIWPELLEAPNLNKITVGHHICTG